MRVADELDEIHRIDRVALLVVDHPEGTDALPTPDGAVLAIGTTHAATQATDARGADLRAALAASDGDAVRGSFASARP